MRIEYSKTFVNVKSLKRIEKFRSPDFPTCCVSVVKDKKYQVKFFPHLVVQFKCAIPGVVTKINIHVCTYVLLYNQNSVVGFSSFAIVK